MRASMAVLNPLRTAPPSKPYVPNKRSKTIYYVCCKDLNYLPLVSGVSS